jgi:hypothetical protein
MGYVEERVKRVWIELPGDIADGIPEPGNSDSLSAAERAKVKKALAEKKAQREKYRA